MAYLSKNKQSKNEQSKNEQSNNDNFNTDNPIKFLNNIKSFN